MHAQALGWGVGFGLFVVRLAIKAYQATLPHVFEGQLDEADYGVEGRTLGCGNHDRQAGDVVPTRRQFDRHIHIELSLTQRHLNVDTCNRMQQRATRRNGRRAAATDFPRPREYKLPLRHLIRFLETKP